jgi:hypothetical protein
MPKLRGSYLAHRQKEIPNSRRGTSFPAVQLAYIPLNEESGFPAVVNVAADVAAQLDKLTAGESLDMVTIETPPYGDVLVVALN